METLMVPGMTERARLASEERRNDVLTMALSELHLASARPTAAPAGHVPRPANVWKRITTAALGIKSHAGFRCRKAASPLAESSPSQLTG